MWIRPLVGQLEMASFLTEGLSPRVVTLEEFKKFLDEVLGAIATYVRIIQPFVSLGRDQRGRDNPPCTQIMLRPMVLHADEDGTREAYGPE
jgi:hypothetical protein